MDRRDKALLGLDIAALRGLEIGPLHAPMVRRHEGPVLYVDHATAPELKAKNRGNPHCDVEAIVEVDAVWGERTLKQCLDGRQVDYVIASHVIEHVPDLIGWLGEIEETLVAGGQLRLMVPDKRYTFDLFRRSTSLADLLVAHLLGARRPGLQQLVDCALNTVHAESDMVWRGAVSRADLDDNDGAASALAMGRRFLESGDYIDVHCWVFSPKDFARLFGRAARCGLIRFRCIRAFDTEPGQIEFVVHLEKCDDAQACAASWDEMGESLGDPGTAPFEAEDGSISADSVAALTRALRAKTAELEIRNAELAEMRSSRSWRATGPMRAALTALRPRRRPG